MEETVPQNNSPEDGIIKSADVTYRIPWLAALLNFIWPGLGYYYNGNFGLGIAWAVVNPIIYVIILWVTLELPRGINLLFFWGVLSSIYLFRVIDVYRLARKNKNYVLKSQNKIILYILFIFISSFFLRGVFFYNYEYYSIPTGSMENTLQVKDRVFTKVYDDAPKKNDVTVYYHRDFGGKVEDSPFSHRIVGVPGDTVKIIDKVLYVNNVEEGDNPAYVYDKVKRPSNFANPRIYPPGLKWNEDNYGPLYIPKKGDVITIDSGNFYYWKLLIIKEGDEENTSSQNERYAAQIITDGKYTVKHNYYFLMGDNRNNSLDSRFQNVGLIREEDVLSKVRLVLMNTGDFFNFLVWGTRAGTKIE